MKSNFYLKKIVPLLIFLFSINPLLAETDIYEPDNNYEQANIIMLYNTKVDKAYPDFHISQNHTFSDNLDEDWIKMYTVKDKQYNISVQPTSNCNPAIMLFESDGTTLIGQINDELAGEDETIGWTSAYTGLTFAKIWQKNPGGGHDLSYELIFNKPNAGAGFGYIAGTISPCPQHTESIEIKTIANEKVCGKAKILPSCHYFMTNETGSFVINAVFNGEHLFTKNIVVVERDLTEININLDNNSVSGDVNLNQKIDLPDAIELIKHISE